MFGCWLSLVNKAVQVRDAFTDVKDGSSNVRADPASLIEFRERIDHKIRPKTLGLTMTHKSPPRSFF